MKNLLWLLTRYVTFTCRTIIVLEWLFDRNAFLSRLAIERRFASVTPGSWRL